MEAGEILHLGAGCILSLVALGIMGYLAVFLISEQLHPMFVGMSDEVGEEFGEDNYLSIVNRLKDVLFWVIYLVLAAPFVYIAYRFLFREESHSEYVREVY